MKLLIRNAHIYSEPYAKRCDVAIEDGYITHIGNVPGNFVPDETKDASSKTIYPGLINAHTHSYLSIFRNYADDVEFDEWLFKRIMPVEDELSGTEAGYAAELAFAEMIKGGTTAFVDMHMFPHDIVHAVSSSGIRAVLSRGLVGEDEKDPGAIRRIDEAFSEMEDEDASCGRISFMLGPHSIYTAGKKLLSHIAGLSEETGLAINMHLAETKKEYDDCINNHGMSPVAYANSLGLLKEGTILAHGVQLDDDDISIIKETKSTIVLCPASNAKLGNGMAKFGKLANSGINLCIGTDGAGSNNSLNMIADMRLLSIMAKASECDPCMMPAKTVLDMATKNAARAIGMDGKLGEIKEGYIADIFFVNDDLPNMRPNFDSTSAIVNSMSGAEICDVIIDGKFVMKDGELLTIDMEKVLFETEKIASKMK